MFVCGGRSDEIGPFRVPPVPGTECEIELTSGDTIRVWRADDRVSYFCHGLTFGGKGRVDRNDHAFYGQDGRNDPGELL